MPAASPACWTRAPPRKKKSCTTPPDAGRSIDTMTDKQKDLFQKFAALASLLALSVVFSIVSPSFLSVGNGMTVALQVTSIAYLGIGATCVIITGGIDLSVGAILALAGVIAALAVKAGAPVAIGMLTGVFVGVACGSVNGLCVTLLKLPPFIATL